MNFTDWEQMKIAGMPEQNKQIDEMRKSWETQQANNLLVSQLQTINNNLQKQIDEQKSQLIDEQKATKRNKLIGWIQFGISSFVGFAGVVVALLAFLINT